MVGVGGFLVVGKDGWSMPGGLSCFAAAEFSWHHGVLVYMWSTSQFLVLLFSLLSLPRERSRAGVGEKMTGNCDFYPLSSERLDREHVSP
jgi:hypothetical protein